MPHKMLKRLRLRKAQVRDTGRDHAGQDPVDRKLAPGLEVNLGVISHSLGGSPDVVLRRFSIGREQEIGAALVFIDGLADKTKINQSILRPLTQWALSPSDRAALLSDALTLVELAGVESLGGARS